MKKEQKPTIALCYDFDKTLSPKNMQEFGLIQKLGLEPKAFWAKTAKLSDEHFCDYVNSYMYYMIKAYKENNLPLTKQSLVESGKSVQLFKGLETWFERINNFGDKLGIKIEHYVISSGLTSIIEGTKIADEFKRIYACEFIYDKDNKPIWPSQAVNYTTKTQFLYRINKGLLDSIDNAVNYPMDKALRPVPFSNIVYIGDSESDVPAMRLTVKNGGHAIGVYNPELKRPSTLLELVRDNRINFYAPADYTEFSMLDSIIKEIILKIKHSYSLSTQTQDQKNEAHKELR
jgi:2-hydroxy-3-keto-5-methylthiopentenyl-1-phosphate phosphatase